MDKKTYYVAVDKNGTRRSIMIGMMKIARPISVYMEIYERNLHWNYKRMTLLRK